MKPYKKTSYKKKTITSNFWNDKRIEYGMTLQDVSDLLGIKRGSISGYFSGFCLPDEQVLSAFCELFNVDVDKGRSEFLSAYSIWGKEHPDYTECGRTYKKITNVPADVEQPKVTPAIDKDIISELIYGKVEYEDFITILETANNGGDILRNLYGKVDYTSYLRIKEALSQINLDPYTKEPAF